MKYDIEIKIDNTIEGYRKFLECKKLQRYKVEGRKILTDEMSYNLVFDKNKISSIDFDSGILMPFQRDVVYKSLLRKRYAVFMDCGLGKTGVALVWANAVSKVGKVLIQCPLSVFEQFQKESYKFIGRKLVNLRQGDAWNDNEIAIINFESMREIDMNGVSGIVLDESSILKQDDGVTKKHLVDLSRNIEYRLACSATPSPNSQEEYAHHSVFLGYCDNSKEFYSSYFRKEGPSWILKPHATDKFYDSLSQWATYIKSPKSLGYEETTEMPCEPEYIFKKVSHNIDLCSDGMLLPDASNGKHRSRIMGELRSSPSSERTKCVVDFVSGKKSIVWCNRNSEELMFSKLIPNSIVISGNTPVEKRIELIDSFRNGDVNTIISKPSVLGWGVNLPQAEVVAYSGYNYSFEEFYQAIRRAHRYGREGRLKVLVPFTDPEMPILSSLRKKIDTFDKDVIKLQERFNRE